MRGRGWNPFRGWAMGLLLCSTSIPSGSSAAGPQSPVEVIRARNSAVEKILESSGDELSADAKEKLKDIINGLMDFRELSRRALAKHWEERTEEERTEFVDVFRQLIRNSSVKKLSIYRADSVTYAEPTIRGDKADVTTIAYKGRKTVEIVYRMHKVGGAWKAYDMVIDGASTARTYRDSFYKEIAKSSYREMYEKLVRKLKEEEGQPSG
ncbi:MAG: phospholipid-binding protein MlaC [Gemmatimonadota bacterium]